MAETRRTTIYLEPDLHRALRLKSIETDTSISDLVTRIGALDYNEVVAETFRDNFVPSPDADCTSQIADLVFSRLTVAR